MPWHFRRRQRGSSRLLPVVIGPVPSARSCAEAMRVGRGGEKCGLGLGQPIIGNPLGGPRSFCVTRILHVPSAATLERLPPPSSSPDGAHDAADHQEQRNPREDRKTHRRDRRREQPERREHPYGPSGPSRDGGCRGRGWGFVFRFGDDHACSRANAAPASFMIGAPSPLGASAAAAT